MTHQEEKKEDRLEYGVFVLFSFDYSPFRLLKPLQESHCMGCRIGGGDSGARGNGCRPGETSPSIRSILSVHHATKTHPSSRRLQVLWETAIWCWP